MTRTDPASAGDAPPLADAHALPRTMGLFALTLYGVGDMLGAGIYGLVGKAAGIMGNAVWLAFVGSMVAATLTGLSYACIGSRYPRAAGAAYVTQRAYRRAALTYVIGLGVAASGLTSMATGANVIAGFVQRLGVDLPKPVLIALFLAALTFVVWRGMRESTWMNVICTLIEVAGLLIVIAVGARYWGGVNYLETPPAADGGASSITLALVLNGAVLTFFSFIGFEDILNVAEEVKDPRRTVPLGLVLALVIATVIYIAVSITAVSVLPYATLAASGNALHDVVHKAAPWFPPGVFSVISIFAVANTALLNYVMGSRLLYGMSRQGLLPRRIGKVHATRRTPHVAIFTLLALVAILALTGYLHGPAAQAADAMGGGWPRRAVDILLGGDPISSLAQATSLLLLGAFVVVNAALIVLKRRPDEPRGGFEVPVVVPALGSLVCLALIVVRVLTPVWDKNASHTPTLIAGGIVAAIIVLYLVLRPANVLADEERQDHVRN
ncbi:MAG TPA: APC family permease [Tepidisphaeraceae bacterium]|nr:APC family permease [Tepidisphaeraceae bacterium]